MTPFAAQIADFNKRGPHYLTYADCARRQNPILFGQAGYEEAPWMTQIVYHSDVLKVLVPN